MADRCSGSPDSAEQPCKITFHILIETADYMSLPVKGSGKRLIRTLSNRCPVFSTETDIVTEHGIQASFSLVDLICKPCQLITAGDLVNSVFIGLRLCLCHTIPGSGLRNLVDDGVDLIFRLLQQLVQFCHCLCILQITDESVTNQFDFVHPYHIIGFRCPVIGQDLYCIGTDFLQFLICSE